MDINKISNEIATLKRAVKTAATASLKDKLKKKIVSLNEVLKDANIPAKRLAMILLGAKRKIFSYTTAEFNAVIKRLSYKAEYSFLKGLTKPEIKDDLERYAKNPGWRFKGRGNYKTPTKKDLAADAGLPYSKRRTYYEKRSNRSDVTNPAKLKDGGNIKMNEIGFNIQEVTKSLSSNEKNQLIKLSNNVVEKAKKKGFSLYVNLREFKKGAEIEIVIKHNHRNIEGKPEYNFMNEFEYKIERGVRITDDLTFDVTTGSYEDSWDENTISIDKYFSIIENAKLKDGGGVGENFKISKIKEIVEKYINLSYNIGSFKILRDDKDVLLLGKENKYKDISIDFRLDMYPNKLWFGGLAKLEVSSVSLADPKLNYLNTSDRRVVHKKINVRKVVSSYLDLEKLLKNFLIKAGELDKKATGGGVIKNKDELWGKIDAIANIKGYDKAFTEVFGKEGEEVLEKYYKDYLSKYSKQALASEDGYYIRKDAYSDSVDAAIQFFYEKLKGNKMKTGGGVGEINLDDLKRAEKLLGVKKLSEINAMSMNELQDELLYAKNTLEMIEESGSFQYDRQSFLDAIKTVVSAKLNKKETGGGVGVENENKEMVLNNAQQIEHHAEELENAAKNSKHVPAWVVAKIYNASSNISDATHYLEGVNTMPKEQFERIHEEVENHKMETGGGLDSFLGKQMHVSKVCKTHGCSTKDYLHAKKKYKTGGIIDINELNLPVIRTQFEDEEYEFKEGGKVKNTLQIKKGDKIVVNKKHEGVITNILKTKSGTISYKWKMNTAPNDDQFRLYEFDYGKRWVLKKDKMEDGGGVGDNQLNVVFSRQDVFEKAKDFYENESAFYPSDVNDEFKTFVFDIENGEADATEFYLDQELQETDLDGYYFEIADKMKHGGNFTGKIMDYTKSGKPIYDERLDHHSYDNYTKQDRDDASRAFAKKHHQQELDEKIARANKMKTGGAVKGLTPERLTELLDNYREVETNEIEDFGSFMEVDEPSKWVARLLKDDSYKGMERDKFYSDKQLKEKIVSALKEQEKTALKKLRAIDSEIEKAFPVIKKLYPQMQESPLYGQAIYKWTKGKDSWTINTPKYYNDEVKLTSDEAKEYKNFLRLKSVKSKKKTGGAVKGAKFKHHGKELEIKKVQDGAVYTTDGKQYSLKVLESLGVTFNKERAKSNKPRGVRGNKREQMQGDVAELEYDLKGYKQDLRQLNFDMELEAGEKGDKWTDADANRYGREMNELEEKIETLKKQIAEKEQKLSYKIGGEVGSKLTGWRHKKNN